MLRYINMRLIITVGQALWPEKRKRMEAEKMR
jgi:hypothetical protein